MITDAQIQAAKAVIEQAGGTISPALVQAALEAAERAAWLPMKDAPKDRTCVLLRLRYPISDEPQAARYFKPWDTWIKQADWLPNSDELEEVEIYGIGSKVPIAWRPMPRFSEDVE